MKMNIDNAILYMITIITIAIIVFLYIYLIIVNCIVSAIIKELLV